MFWKSEFGRNIAKMLGGVGLAQVINFAASLVLARLYDEADFGRLALFTSLMMLLTNLAGLRYELATVLPRRPEKALAVLALALRLNLLFGLLALLLVGLGRPWLAQYPKLASLGPLLWLVPLALFLLSAFNSFNYWYTRQKAFGWIARVQVAQTSVGALAQLGLASVLPGVGLIWGYLLPALRSVAREYREFPLVNAPHVGLDVLQNEGIVFLVVYFFTESLVGSYAFALRIVKAPLGIIGRALTPVFYQRASELHRENPAALRDLIRQIYGRLLLVGLPGFALLFFGAPSLFALLFGENWRLAGQIASILTPWLLLNFIASPVSQLPLVVGRQKTALALAGLGVLLKLGALLAAGWLEAGELRAFLYLCLGASLYQAIVLLWYYWIAGMPTSTSSKNEDTPD